MNQKPTALELYFEGSFVGRYGHFELFRKGSFFYRINSVTEMVDKVPDTSLELMMF